MVDEADRPGTIDAWIEALKETHGESTIRRWEFIQRAERGFMTALALVCIGLFTYYGYLIAQGGPNAIPPAAIVWLTTGFCLYFGIFGVLSERWFDMICCAVSYTLVCISLTWEAQFTDQGEKVIRILVCCIAWLFLIPALLFLRRFASAYRESRRLLQRTVAERTEMMTACDAVYRFKALLVLDFQMTLGVCISLCYLSAAWKWVIVNAVLVGLGFPLAVIYLLFGIRLMRTEKSFFILAVLSVFQPICIVELCLNFSEMVGTTDVRDIAILAGGITMTVGFVALCVKVVLMVALVAIRKNFGKGLNYLMFPDRAAVREARSSLRRGDKPAASTYNTMQYDAMGE